MSEHPEVKCGSCGNVNRFGRLDIEAGANFAARYQVEKILRCGGCRAPLLEIDADADIAWLSGATRNNEEEK